MYVCAYSYTILFRLRFVSLVNKGRLVAGICLISLVVKGCERERDCFSLFSPRLVCTDLSANFAHPQNLCSTYEESTSVEHFPNDVPSLIVRQASE